MHYDIHAPTLLAHQGNGQVTDQEFAEEVLPSYLASVRRYLHAHPETGFQERETSAFLQEQLAEQGLHCEGPLAETGFCVDIEGAEAGPSVGYRCDMDALPMQDAKLAPYASRNPGATHACGHDAHMAVGLGVALTLSRMRSQLAGRVRVFFQPNEEGTPSGSVPMIRDGVLSGLEAVYCIHVDPTLDVGSYGLAEGTVTAALDRFRVRLDAPSTGHSARPHQSRDLIWIATQLLTLFYQYAGRITDVRNPAILTVCTVRGGEIHNVMPSEVEFQGTLRTLNDGDREFLKQYMRHTAEQIAALHDVHLELEIQGSMPSAVNDDRMLSLVREQIIRLFGKKAPVDILHPSMGAEDFAHYLDYIPGLLLRVGTRGSRHTSHMLHNALFDVDDAALAPTVKLMSQVLQHHLATRPLA